MGKTQSGAVWLDPEKTSPFEFYQYWRNVADADVLKCLRMLTDVYKRQIAMCVDLDLTYKITDALNYEAARLELIQSLKKCFQSGIFSGILKRQKVVMYF